MTEYPDREYMTPDEFAVLGSDAQHAVWRAHAEGRVDATPRQNIRQYHRVQVLELLARIAATAAGGTGENDA